MPFKHFHLDVTHLKKIKYFLWQGGGCKYHIKYKGQDCCTSSLSMHQAYRCHWTVIALWQAYEVTTVDLHLYNCCILIKKIEQFVLCIYYGFSNLPLSRKKDKTIYGQGLDYLGPVVA